MELKKRKSLQALADSIKSNEETGVESQSRRIWLQNLGLISLSSVVLWNCGKSSDDAAVASVNTDPKADAAQYAAALALEEEAVRIYTAAAGLDNIKTSSAANANGAVLAIAGGFLAHHTDHHAMLTAAIKKLQADNPAAGIPDPAKLNAAAAEIDAATVSLLTDATYGVANVLRLAALKELAAAQAYVKLIPTFTNVANAHLHGMIGADEAAHYGVLRAALLVVVTDGGRDNTLTAANVVSASDIEKATATKPA